MGYIKIYFGDRPLIITNEREAAENHRQNTHFLTEVNDVLPTMEEEGFERVVLFTDNADEAKETIFSGYKTIRAAGGLVRNDAGEILLIFRRGHWDLPKGKQDEGETIEVCAVREVQEETGLAQVRILNPIAISYHTYLQDGQDILKETHWFLMEAAGAGALTPQAEEDIEKAIWINPADAAKYYQDMYPLIKDILAKEF